MVYSDKVLSRNKDPKNVGSLDSENVDVGTGLVGSPACGDVLRLQVRVENGVIVDAKFKTFGCGAAIASSSLATEELIGMAIDEVRDWSDMNKWIASELCLPPVKFHCSVLAREAVIAALRDYMSKQKVNMNEELDLPLNVARGDVVGG